PPSPRDDPDIGAPPRPALLAGLPAPEATRPILKRPLDRVVSALRALAADTDGGVSLQKHLTAMGQPLYQWPMPDGFPEKPTAWMGSLLPRWDFALALTANAIDGTTVDLNAPLAAAQAHTDDDILTALLETVLARPHDAPELRAVRAQVRGHIAKARKAAVPDGAVLAEATGLLLASPAYQMR